MLYAKWATCYIYYKTSEGLVIFWHCLTLENEGAMILQGCGNHSPSDAVFLTQWRFVTHPVPSCHIPEEFNTQV